MNSGTTRHCGQGSALPLPNRYSRLTSRHRGRAAQSQTVCWAYVGKQLELGLWHAREAIGLCSSAGCRAATLTTAEARETRRCDSRHSLMLLLISIPYYRAPCTSSPSRLVPYSYPPPAPPASSHMMDRLLGEGEGEGEQRVGPAQAAGGFSLRCRARPPT